MSYPNRTKALLCSLLLALGRAHATAGQPLQLTPTAVSIATGSPAAGQPVSARSSPFHDPEPAKPTDKPFLGQIALAPQLPTLAAAPRQAPGLTLTDAPQFEHSPLRDSLLTAPFDTTAERFDGLRVRSVTAAAAGLSGLPSALGTDSPSVRVASASLNPIFSNEKLIITGASLYAPTHGGMSAPSTDRMPPILGRTWALTSDNLLLHRRLRIRAEYVRTDNTGGGPTADAVGGAYDIGVALLTPRGALPYEDWNVELHYARIGPRLWTPRDPGMTKDVALWQANATRTRGNLALALACTNETQSADSMDSSAWTQMQTWEGRLQYALPRDWKNFYWLGRPTVGLHVQRQHWQIAGSGQAGSAGRGETLTSEDVNLAFRTPAPLTWHVNTGWTTGAQTFTHRYELGMTVFPGAGLRFAPTYVLQSTRSHLQTVPSQVASGIVQAQVPLLGGKASLHFDAEVDRLEMGQNPDRNWQRSINGQLVWHAVKSHGRRPAVTVGVSGTQQWTSAAPSAGSWQVLASVDVVYGPTTD